MCLGVPGKVVEIMDKQPWAVVDTMGLVRKVGLHLLESVRPGDYVMVHAGYAIEIVDLEEALERIKIWKEFLAYGSAESLP